MIADDFAAIARARRRLHGFESPRLTAKRENSGPCKTCADRGWTSETYYGIVTPGFKECPKCKNPDKLPKP